MFVSLFSNSHLSNRKTPLFLPNRHVFQPNRPIHFHSHQIDYHLARQRCIHWTWVNYLVMWVIKTHRHSYKYLVQVLLKNWRKKKQNINLIIISEIHIFFFNRDWMKQHHCFDLLWIRFCFDAITQNCVTMMRRFFRLLVANVNWNKQILDFIAAKSSINLIEYKRFVIIAGRNEWQQ